MSVEIADLVANLRGETAQFDAAMLRADRALKGVHGSAGGASSAVKTLTEGLGGLALGALALAVKQASDFSTMMTNVQNNTTMTSADVSVMRAGILQLASQSNAPMQQLATGFMHITNLGFSAKDAVQILRQAMMSATSTGGNTADVADLLANVMHEFGLQASQAGEAMDVLHLASAKGNSTLEQFSTTAGKTLALAANLHVPLTDVAAAMAAMTNHGLNAAAASTTISGALSKILNPAVSTTKELTRISKLTGIDLVGDFTQAGLRSKGLAGVLTDLARASQLTGVNILKLIPATRGGLAAMVLTGTGAKDYRGILLSLNDAMAGKVHPTFAAFQRTQQTLGFQLGQLRNILQIIGITIGSVLLPPLLQLVKFVGAAVLGFLNWIQHSPAIQAAIKALGPLVQTLAGFLKTAWDDVSGWVAAFVKFLGQHPAIVRALAEIAKSFLAIAVAKKAIDLVIEGLKALLVFFIGKNALAVLVAVLYTAWDQNWGGMRDFLVNNVWPKIHPILNALHDFSMTPIGLDVILAVLSLAAAMGTLMVAMRGVAAAQAALAGLGALFKGIGDIFGGGGGKPAATGPDQAMKDLTSAITKYFPPLTVAIRDYVALLEDAIVKYVHPLTTAITDYVALLEDTIHHQFPQLTDAIDHLATKFPIVFTLPKIPPLLLDDVALIGAIKSLTAKLPMSWPKIPALELQDGALITALQNLTAAIPGIGHGPTGGTGGTGKGTGGTFTLFGAQALTTALTTLNTTTAALNTTLHMLIAPKLDTLNGHLAALIAKLGGRHGGGTSTTTIPGLGALTTALGTLNTTTLTLNQTILTLIAKLGSLKFTLAGPASGGAGLDFGAGFGPITFHVGIDATDLKNAANKVAGWLGAAGDMGKAVLGGAARLAQAIGESFGRAWSENTDAVKNFGTWITTHVADFKGAAANLGNIIWGEVTNMANATIAGAHKFSEAISYLAAAGWATISGAVTALGTKLAAGLFDVKLFGEAMMATLKSLAGQFLSYFSDLLSGWVKSHNPFGGLSNPFSNISNPFSNQTLGQAPNGGQNLGLSALAQRAGTTIVNNIIVDGKTMSTSVFNAAANDRRMRPELVTA